METIIHRVNTCKDLLKVPSNYGVEIDLRTHNQNIILSHDPYSLGELFDNFLNIYTHGTLILNVKTEGIEFDIIDKMNKNNICNYFFLDNSYAMINKFISIGFKQFALRFSVYESLSSLKLLTGLAEWVWIDYFGKHPLSKANYYKIKNMGFKICIASPDIVEQKEAIKHYIDFFRQINELPDAICVKINNQYLWQQINILSKPLSL